MHRKEDLKQHGALKATTAYLKLPVKASSTISCESYTKARYFYGTRQCYKQRAKSLKDLKQDYNYALLTRDRPFPSYLHCLCLKTSPRANPFI